MKKILFPTDFSPCAHNAFAYALELAKLLDARVDLVSIYNLPVGEASNVPPEYIQRMLNEKRQATLKNLQNFIVGFPADHIGELRADYGVFVYQEVTDIAHDKGHDLIVMGTKGQHNAMEKLMGSVTTHTMMHASCPVLAIPEEAAFHPIKTIAFASDFSKQEDEAMKHLLSLGKEVGAAIHFVHVETSEEGELKGDKQVKVPSGFADITVLHSATPMAAIDEYVREKHIDWLAIFIPRRRLWERLFHSSFSKKMAFHTKIPLITFHQ